VAKHWIRIFALTLKFDYWLVLRSHPSSFNIIISKIVFKIFKNKREKENIGIFLFLYPLFWTGIFLVTVFDR